MKSSIDQDQWNFHPWLRLILPSSLFCSSSRSTLNCLWRKACLSTWSFCPHSCRMIQILVYSTPASTIHWSKSNGKLLDKSIQAQGFITCVIERPESMEIKHWCPRYCCSWTKGTLCSSKSIAWFSVYLDIIQFFLRLKGKDILGWTQQSGH